jgi:hypothetical protein
MKKHLLLVAAALFAGVAAYAQAIVINGEAMGLTSSATDVAKGTVIGSNEAIELSVAFDDQYKIVDLKCNGYTTIVIDGQEIGTSNGIQGSSNPKGEGGASCAGTTGADAQAPAAPVQGAVLQLVSKKPGYVVVWSKMTATKNYTVFEEGDAIGYRGIMNTTNGTIDYTVEGEGEFNNVKTAISTPLVYTGDTVKTGNGLGILLFPVAGTEAEPLTYLVNAVGSKISAGGVYFSESANISVILKGDEVEDLVLLGDAQSGNESGISTINGSAKVSSVKYYNVSGQEIKGLVKGINIVKRTLSDGTVQCVKVLNK